MAERVEAKAAEAIDHVERANRLPWWHRKRRRHKRAADRAIREGLTLLAGGEPRR